MELLSRRGWSGVTKWLTNWESTSPPPIDLTTLRDRGLVEQDAATEKYRLGFGLITLASSVTADLDVARCSRPVCDWLAERTRETVTVAVLEGDDAVILYQSNSRSSALSVDWSGMHLRCMPLRRVRSSCTTCLKTSGVAFSRGRCNATPRIRS